MVGVKMAYLDVKDLYGRALELEPGNRRLQARAQEAARLHDQAIRMQTVEAREGQGQGR